MRALAAELVSKGMAREAADLLDRETLIAAGDERLVIQALKATAGYYGPSSAVDLAEDVLEHLDPVRGPATAELKGHIKGLYMDWIRDRMDQGDTYGAWRAHKRSEGLFPEDPELRLLGIEIALEDGDWRTADRLLSVKRFPRELAERAARLTDQVDELRSEEGKIVIRFQPGLRHIPVRALINGSVEQDFVIDTGASLVTIPSTTAHALDLRMDGSTPQRWISTAGGPALAREVTLAAITLKGREVNRVKAWVLDIPGRPRMGLLGLNYLNRFHVEIDSDRGVLMLKPRS
jgi:clan AA aspartic protease (TIGR02281 family)